jgi:hypothetical protein
MVWSSDEIQVVGLLNQSAQNQILTVDERTVPRNRKLNHNWWMNLTRSASTVASAAMHYELMMQAAI